MCPCAGRSGVRRRQAWALKKVPPQQVLAILAAVGTAVFSGAPHKPNSGGAPGWPVQTERWLAGVGRESTEPGFLESMEQSLDLDSGVQPIQPPHLHIPAEAAAGADSILPKSTWGPLGLPSQGQGWPHEPPNRNFESRCGEVHVLSCWRA